MKNNINRESNFELLRIISMFFIVLWHTLIFGNQLTTPDNFNSTIYNLIMCVCVVHVSTYVLLTGYFQIESKFKPKKLLNILLQIGFYNLIIALILKKFNLVNFTNTNFLKSIFFFNLESYWFLKNYIILYILSPFFNNFIKNNSKASNKKLILTIFTLNCILPFITNNLFLSSNGYDLFQFCLLYFVGAYIKIYKPFNNLKINISQKRITLILIFIICIIFNFSLLYLGKHLINVNNGLLKEIGYNLITFNLNYNNPLIVLQTISLFLLISTIKIKSKFINIISSTTLGIYIIHENCHIRANLYNWLGVSTLTYGKLVIIKVLLYATFIFFVCSIIELLRKGLFKLLSKIKLVNKISFKITKSLKSLIEIN